MFVYFNFLLKIINLKLINSFYIEKPVEKQQNIIKEYFKTTSIIIKFNI